ncbi:MAG: hypothetical protein ACK52U_15250 [Synechococcaceae cyanobacterium]
MATACLVVLHTGGSAMAAPLTTGSDSLKILFSGGVDPATGLLHGSPALNATFPDGQQGTFIMDTGSAGMVVYNTSFSPPSGAPAYTDVIQAYKSDNLLFQGDVYLTQVEIGTPGNSVTANVPVLDASQQRCADPSQSCTLASSWRFIGVGFGEVGAGNTAWPINGTQRNPLFNITAINGVSANPTQGWIMASDGITVGLTPANTASFNPAGLEPLSTSPDGFNRGSAAVFASPTVPGQAPPSLPPVPFSGTVLVDSGVSYAMMVLSPGAPRPNTVTCPYGPHDCTDSGYTITVYLGNPAAPLLYQVITGANGTISASPFDAAAPDFVNQLSDSAAFWNTSNHFYKCLQLLV